MLESVRLKGEGLYSIAFGSISGTYALLGRLINPSQVYFVQNLTNATLTFSQDGANDLFQLPANGFLLIDAGANKGNYNVLSFPAGTSIFVKGAPGSGQANLTSWYMG